MLGPAIAASGGLLVLSWFLPVMTVRSLIVLSDGYSIIEGIVALLDGGDHLLALVILLFSIIFPSAKLVCAFYLWWAGDKRSAQFKRLLRWLETFGKWSMLDVFVIALLVVAAKSSWITEIDVEPGIIAFALAILSSMLIVARLGVLAKEPGSEDAFTSSQP